ncbi:MAG TPA: ectonucleotide pyrophosphatase/phosphodiesterase [Rhizomicrobium sp.]|jgi:predicted AlkP superfamily pyrophosphatase or phosphodiesterase|nr:ectonucleotide pyrophosphatase/phosphodiesterase [Rhizomicrobium sp.]
MKIKTAFAAAVCAMALAGPARATPHKLLVISVDGLDWRYLRDRDALGLSIPNIRKLLARSQTADGVTGVWPTITWPSHTTMLTGVRPSEHGILANASGPPDPALSYWSANKIKVPTLTQCVTSAGRTVGAVNWPVTVDARINWNLPEVYARRNGDSSDMDTVDRFGTPGLVAEIGRAYPSFPQAWLDDRSRALATIYLLKRKHPDLLLLHFAELDSEEHEGGPFTPHAKAVVERTDELIGDVLKAVPRGYDLALVSDHGFERVDHLAGLKAMAAADGITGEMTVAPGLVVTKDPAVVAWLRQQSGKGDVGREVPADELTRYTSLLSGTTFEPAPHVMFGNGPARSAANPEGNHGFWPTRPDYHSIFLLSGPGIKAASLGTLEMVSLKDRFAAVLGLTCPGP